MMIFRFKRQVIKKYPKILNLFKFDQETKCRTTEFSCDEFEYLKDYKWIFTEKIDGMNIRVIFDENGEMEIRGRTDKAQLPPDIVMIIKEMFKKVQTSNVVFYGEGYGPGINKGGKYRNNKSFILFDVYDNDAKKYIPYADTKAFSLQSKIPIVPIIGEITLMEAYELVKKGMPSQFGNFYAEGLVGTFPFLNEHGKKVRVKIKHRDYFEKELQEV